MTTDTLRKTAFMATIATVAFAPVALAENHNNVFPRGSCEGPNKSVSGSDTTFCGAISSATTNWYVQPNAVMYGAILSGQDLTGAKLSDVNFWDADLSGVNLSGADLKAGNLYKAILKNANLSGADLSDANLWGADLTGSNLGGAVLTGAFGNDATICPNGQSRAEPDNDCGF